MTADLAYNPAEPRGKGGRWVRFYWGTREIHSPGEVISGGKIHYYTPMRALAGNYSAGAQGNGPRRVYEVEPVEGHRLDPEYGDTGLGWMADKIRIVGEVSHAGTIEPGDTTPPRNTLRRLARQATPRNLPVPVEASTPAAAVELGGSPQDFPEMIA
jgi:hypothetical protein